MSDDSNDEAELLAALNSFNPADVGGSSDSDDDGITAVDTSTVSLILAARHSSHAANFASLADALQSVAVAESSVAMTELEPTEAQIARAARAAALEASLSDCRILVSSVAQSAERPYACPPIQVPSVASSSEQLRMQERAAQKEADHRRAIEREQQRLLRAQQLQQQQEIAEARAVDLQRRQAELAAAALLKRQEEERQRQQMELWFAERAAAAQVEAAAAEAKEREEMQLLKEERLALQDKMQRLADAEQHRQHSRQEAQEQQAARIDDLRAAARAAAAEKAAARATVSSAVARAIISLRYSRCRPAAAALSSAVAAVLLRRRHARRLSAAVVALYVLKQRTIRCRYSGQLISYWNSCRPAAIPPNPHGSFLADQDLRYASALPPPLRQSNFVSPPLDVALSVPLLLLLPRAVAVETGNPRENSYGRAGVVTWTNAATTHPAQRLSDGIVLDDVDLKCKASTDSAQSVASFNRRGLSRLPPDFSSFSASLVIFSCAGNSLQNLDFGGKLLPNLRQLDCSCNRLTSLSFCSSLPSLHLLTCDENPIVDAAGAAACSRLLSLSLNKCALASGDFSFLSACPQLVHLHCSGNPLRGFLRLSPMLHLRSVDVSGSEISGCDGLAACPLLERVVLFHTQMAEAPPSGVVMGSLCEMFLNNCKLTWIRECPSLPLLRYLSLADNRIERLPPLSGCPALLHLDLSFNCLSRTEDIQSFTSCPLLQRLHLNDNPLCMHPLYRSLVIACSACLVELDATPVAANERDAAVAALGGVSQRWAGLLKAVNGGQLRSSVCPTAIANVAAGFASQVKLWEGLGALSHTINERDRRNSVLSMHNADLRAATAVGDDLQMLQLRLKQLMEIDSSSRARVLHASSSPCLRSSVCPNTSYSLRRDAWLLARNTAAAAVLQAAVRVLSAHAFVGRRSAAGLLQRTWRQHVAMAEARACGGKAARVAAVKIQSSWRGHWLRVKKERALKKARAAWGEDDMDDDLEDIMAALKAPDNLFAQPQFMSQMQRVYSSSIDVAAVSASAIPQPYPAAASLPPLPRPSAAVAFRSTALVPAHSAPEDGASPHVTHHTAPVSHPPPAALAQRNYNPPASAPAATSAEEDLGSAWGITDPRTLAALKKREAKFKGKDALRRQKEAMATADGRLEYFRTHAGGGATVTSSGRSGVAPRPRDAGDAFRGESVGAKSLTLEALQSPQHGALMASRDSVSWGGGMQRAAQYSPAMSSVSTVDLDSVPSQPKRQLPEGFRSAPMVNNFMGGVGGEGLGVVASRRLQVARRQ